jgi:phosphatidylinositol alpha-1,6-mannosyltransferase
MTPVPADGAHWPHDYELRPVPPQPERRLGERRGDAVAALRRLRTAAYFLALRRYAANTVAPIAGAEGAIALIGVWDTVSHFWCEACRRARVPYAIFAHGAEIVAPLYGRLPAWRHDDFHGAAVVLANSIATARLAASRLGLPVAPAVVHPVAAAPPPAADIAVRAEALQREWAIDGPMLLTVGRLVPRKGVDVTLRAVAALKSRYPNLRYVVAGEGGDRARLEALAAGLGIASMVRFAGEVDELTKRAALHLCDVFVMPNRTHRGKDWEGFGIVFLEAALAGRPVVGGRSGGAADAIGEGVTGLLVDPENASAVTRAVEQLLNDPGLRDRFGREGACRARSQFSPAAAARALEAALGLTSCAGVDTAASVR